MPCYKPTEIMIRRKALTGKRKYETAYPQVVPCGSCVGCRAEQSRQWAVRMMHEARMHKSNLFVTLTLNDENLNENSELDDKDLSRFVKSLRKKQDSKRGTFSFFACGEYGEKTARPHYHALLFGIKFLDMCPNVTPGRAHVWQSKTLEDTWGRGLTEIGTVSMASASYVAGYIRKKVRDERYERANPETGELMAKEFARMSLRPAIGRRWIEKWWRDVYPRDFVVVDGYEAKPPRYYDKYMDLTDDKGGTHERRSVMERVRTRRYDEAVEMTKYQLMSGEKIHQARVALFAGRDQI